MDGPKCCMCTICNINAFGCTEATERWHRSTRGQPRCRRYQNKYITLCDMPRPPQPFLTECDSQQLRRLLEQQVSCQLLPREANAHETHLESLYSSVLGDIADQASQALAVAVSQGPHADIRLAMPPRSTHDHRRVFAG
eukprot:scaffold1338_cov364-Prasinococcus_capsulatus_cf.AAC.4